MEVMAAKDEFVHHWDDEYKDAVREERLTAQIELLEAITATHSTPIDVFAIENIVKMCRYDLRKIRGKLDQ